MTAKMIIGVDPHKTAHTAVAVDDKESQLAKLEVRANASQLKRLLAWAEPFAKRTWAIEGSGGCGYLLAQQLVDAGEHVLLLALDALRSAFGGASTRLTVPRPAHLASRCDRTPDLNPVP